MLRREFDGKNVTAIFTASQPRGGRSEPATAGRDRGGWCRVMAGVGEDSSTTCSEDHQRHQGSNDGDATATDVELTDDQHRAPADNVQRSGTVTDSSHEFVV